MGSGSQESGDSHGSDLQEDGWLGGWMDRWKDRPFTQIGNLEMESDSEGSSEVGVSLVVIGKAYELNLETY